MINNISLFYNQEKESAVKTVQIVKETLSMNNVKFVIDDISRETRLAICVGGDGTVLKTARKVLEFEIPVACINVGTLGFLGIEPRKIESFITSLINENYEIQERIMLEAEWDSNKVKALNEIVIKNGDTARVINLELYIDEKKVYNLRGDGIIISTPTGSTAYSLAAGGPVVSPELDLLVVTPLNPHSLHSRSLILGKTTIKIRSVRKGREVILTADGQLSSRLQPGTEVKIHISTRKLRLVKGDKSFFDLLSQKMDWS